MSSGGMLTQKLNVDDLQFEKGTFDGTMAYAQNKVANFSSCIHLKALYRGSNSSCAVCGVFFVYSGSR